MANRDRVKAKIRLTSACQATRAWHPAKIKMRGFWQWLSWERERGRSKKLESETAFQPDVQVLRFASISDLPLLDRSTLSAAKTQRPHPPPRTKTMPPQFLSFPSTRVRGVVLPRCNRLDSAFAQLGYGNLDLASKIGMQTIRIEAGSYH